MSKEIKEKCKMCRYYNDKQQYPDVEGQTTHSNCISIKCQYSKMTKDMQIRSLTNKIADLEAKLAISEKALELACERIKYFKEMQDREMGHFEFFGYDNKYDLQAIIKKYIDKAKELKSE